MSKLLAHQPPPNVMRRTLVLKEAYAIEKRGAGGSATVPLPELLVDEDAQMLSAAGIGNMGLRYLLDLPRYAPVSGEDADDAVSHLAIAMIAAIKRNISGQSDALKRFSDALANVIKKGIQNQDVRVIEHSGNDS